jgi:hypothetical protein
LQAGIDGMQRVGELHIEGGVVFGRYILAVRFLPHFHAGDRVAARFEIADFRRRICRVCCTSSVSARLPGCRA